MSRYYGLSDYLKLRYGRKLVKLSIDGGFTCPNRDGTLSSKGCVFCSLEGSGDFAGEISCGVKKENQDIQTQIDSQKALLSAKWTNVGFIAYFQSYTNTYKPIQELEAIYKSALACEGIEGLAIATRPDCIDASHIELFKTIDVLWVELGLQSIHDEKNEWLNRHYTLEDVEKSTIMLQKAGIPVVLHLIAGLPGETFEDFMASMDFITRIKPFGVKIHMLHIVKNTALSQRYQETPFELLDEATYIRWVCEGIGRLDPEIVIHRMTGDGKRAEVIAPTWTFNKRHVLNGIQKYLAEKDIVQGCYIKN
ncbi:MAG: TIGR01212 family radical SAM protein [Clostridiales bacterium 38-18]|nr:MAG: TIGR01212 family radical SAM protein [Clostridiales bacterium 38-18]